MMVGPEPEPVSVLELELVLVLVLGHLQKELAVVEVLTVQDRPLKDLVSAEDLTAQGRRPQNQLRR